MEKLANRKKLSNVPFVMENEEYLWRWSTISDCIFHKISVPSDCQPKFPDWLNGKHPKFGLSEIMKKSFGQ